MTHYRSPGLVQTVLKFLVQSKCGSTNIKYFSYFKKWCQFIESHGAAALPASSMHIAFYLTDLIDQKAYYSVICSSVYSIKWAHALRNRFDPTNNTFLLIY